MFRPGPPVSVRASVVRPGLVLVETDDVAAFGPEVSGWLSGGDVGWVWDDHPTRGDLAVVLSPKAGVRWDGRSVVATVGWCDTQVAQEICFDHQVALHVGDVLAGVAPGFPVAGWPARELIQLSAVSWEEVDGLVRVWAQPAGFGFSGSDPGERSPARFEAESWRLCQALNEEVGTCRSVWLEMGALVAEVDAAMAGARVQLTGTGPVPVSPERFRVEVFLPAAAAARIRAAGFRVEVRVEVEDVNDPDGGPLVLPLPLTDPVGSGAPRP